VAGLAALVVAVSAAGAPTNVDYALQIGAGIAPNDAGNWKNSGETVTLQRESFFVVLEAAPLSAAPQATVKVRFELSAGLRWGGDSPDPGENCTSTATTGECNTIPGEAGSFWYWDVVAAGPGRYTYRAEIVEASDPDPNAANNASTITIVVAESGGGGSGGSGGSGGGSGSGGTGAVATAGAARVAPARPRAGARVTATVRVSAGGQAVRPTRVRCTGRIGTAAAAGSPKAAAGAASCTYRTQVSARGKTLRGTIAFTARGQRFTRSFSARLA
jgi:hypothetical protein